MLTEKDVLNIAKLSDLYIKEEDIPQLLKDMQQMIEFSREVTTLESEEPLGYDETKQKCLLREDEVSASYPSELVLMNAPEKKEGYILLRQSE